eukprot:GEZU01016048.1.p1 GENE.GEZU01016048.1~~GEZU01016048.1.p1  ORF type:complete len:154 (-),score=18.02 GEZU01016048.1:82-477(-)
MGTGGSKQKFHSLEALEGGDVRSEGSHFKWNLFSGVARENNQPVTVFEYTRNVQAGADDPSWKFALESVKRFKTLRHPSILKYVDSMQVEEHQIFIATDSVQPLRKVFPSLDLPEIALGLYHIAVIFFHLA